MAAQSSRVLPEMFDNGATNSSGQPHRNSIANEVTQLFATNWFPRFCESVFSGKTLQNSSFTKRDCSILFRMAEPAIPKTIELGCDGWTRFIPAHSAIHTGIC